MVGRDELWIVGGECDPREVPAAPGNRTAERYWHYPRAAFRGVLSEVRPDAHAPPCGGGCGDCLPAENTTTPNVLLVGDSISMGSYGYAWYVRELLAANSSGLATVQHAGGFGGGGQFASVASHRSCFSGPESTYLRGHHFDVATYNAGIHGCCNSSERVTDAAYTADLRLVLTGLAAHASHVKFVTTTPVSYAVSQPPSTILARVRDRTFGHDTFCFFSA